MNNPSFLFDKNDGTRAGAQSGEFFDARTWKEELHLDNFGEKRNITRKELAVVLNYYAENFKQHPVTFEGHAF